MTLTEIDADAAGSKLGKIDDLQQVPGGDTQLNLHDGQNLLVDEGSQYSGGDSVVVDNETSEVVAHFPYEEGELVTAVRGQHAGEIGRIEEIQVTPGSGDNGVLVEGVAGSGDFETVEPYVVVIDENFVEGGLDEASAEDDETEEGDDE